ncbi:MAG: hypothetical protein LCH69_20115 [Proteobacteria bacterium]|nr:hypothetical protein [Pseudomonadota bacterium]
MKYLLALLIATLPFAGAEAQNCRVDTTTRKCIFVPKSQQRPPDFTVGDVFPVYEHSMLLDIDSYGLKPVDGPWRYYKSGPDIYRVAVDGYKVLEVIRTARRR